MSFRLNLYFVDKDKINKFNWKNFDYDTFYNFKKENLRSITELGDFLNLKDTPVLYEDGDCEYRLLSKENLYTIIEEYHNHLGDFYKNLFDKSKDPTPNNLDNITYYFRIKTHIYANWKSYMDMDINNERLTQSDRFEHDVFDLIRIYKTTDFNKTKLILISG